VLLEKDGWIVVRIWEREVKSAADSCVDRIGTMVKSRLQEKTCREYRLTDGAASPVSAAG
jgi:very-short-patch-repair endonuclease